MILKLTIITGLLFLIGAFIMVLTHLFKKLTGSQIKRDWLKFGVYLAIITGLLLIGFYGRWLIASVLVVIAIGGSIELYVNLRLLKSNSVIISNMFFLLLILALGHLLLENYYDWYARYAFIVLLISVTDSYSQLFGRLLGKRKLCPRLSPAKTIEGLIGGVVSALIISCLLKFLLPDITIFRILMLGLVIAISAIAGDLIFSFIKRKIGIKDFSGILPGHGGILDRFDSLIAAAPVSYWAWFLIIR
ncbi:MAG: CDP-archaeol synthase [Candidatus Zixiibacteriota bacterium]|nr:MAG: CDP-archaeol synthase [candidate division Zixibacteria bacterium]